MRAWAYLPGVPAAGHVTSSGAWHPGGIEGCQKCPRQSFTCPKCGRTSYNVNDMREGYCGNCHEWTGKR